MQIRVPSLATKPAALQTFQHHCAEEDILGILSSLKKRPFPVQGFVAFLVCGGSHKQRFGVAPEGLKLPLSKALLDAAARLSLLKPETFMTTDFSY